MTSTYHSNRHEPSAATIRLDRMAHPQWNALPEAIRSDIEARIPDGCHLSILSAYWNGHDYHARLFRGRDLIAEASNGWTVDDAAHRALWQYEHETVELREGFVVERLENRGIA